MPTVTEPTLVDLSTLKRRDVILGLASGALMLAGCETNAVTGRSQFIGLAPGEQQLAAMALDSWAKQKQDTPISRDPALNAQLQRVGRRISAASGLTNVQWEFVVFDKDDKNAFVLPGGKVGFYRGLMQLAQNDAQIAAVMGHEVGHVQARHAAERYSQQVGSSLAMAGAQVALASSQNANAYMAAIGLGAQVGILLPYSRLQETEADRVGVDNMHRAGYDVREAVKFWELMAGEGGSRGPTILSTHPSPQGRMAELRAYIAQRGYAQM
ncbi:MAG: M48 family metallopeptidase [Hyphomonadaceae bacterium]|nr:M48 family metallopeptidase [Hyphomonadaceae bacterium]